MVGSVKSASSYSGSHHLSPSDLAGKNFEDFDAGWQQVLRERLRQAGFPIGIGVQYHESVRIVHANTAASA